MGDHDIYVTEPSLAPLDEYINILRGVWDSKILTHNGPILQLFEEKLSEKLSIENFIAVTNGTVAIQMAIKALELEGEIITTPFTWIATTSAIKWERCTPVFCDIDPETLNIDPKKIEALINGNTAAILPVHVFGNPCDVEALAVIAKKYNLKIIYDAAHALGSTYKDKSLLEYGDISTVSLHATKLLNTAEGGGCVTVDSELGDKLKSIRFFGHDDQKNIIQDGFNGKMTEVHAALGLANLKYYDAVLQSRKEKYIYYKDRLSVSEGIKFQNLEVGANYSYFPVIFDSEEKLLKVKKALNHKNVFPRRYFYPSLETLSCVNVTGKINCPITDDISQRILCLPLYYGLSQEEQAKIIMTVLGAL